MTLEEERAAQIAQQENTVISGMGLRDTLYSLLDKNDIDNARKMFACHNDEALEAIKYHDPAKHDIMSREDKLMKDGTEYKTAKMPRNLCEVANNTGTFFMFGNPLTLTLGNSPAEAAELEDAFTAFKDFLTDVYFHERMYEARQIAGSETECAKIYDLFLDEDAVPHISCRNHKNSDNEKLFTMFNQHGQLVAFALGYYLRANKVGVIDIEEHFDVWTTKFIYYYTRSNTDSTWRMNRRRINPFGKIPVIYYRHETDWSGAEHTIDRMEWVLSKHADTVDYFGDPYLVVTQDVVNNRLAGAKEIGKVIVKDDATNSQFEFVEAPNGGDLVKDHIDELKEDMFIDTMNPDMSYKSIKGLGTLSGEAMRRIYVPGYIKRTKFAVKIYNEMIRREINLIKAILINYVYLTDSALREKIARLKIRFDYTDPFVGGIEDNTEQIQLLVAQGAMSIRAAVDNNRFVTDKDAEYERIWQEYERKAMIDAKVAKMSQTTTTEQS